VGSDAEPTGEYFFRISTRIRLHSNHQIRKQVVPQHADVLATSRFRSASRRADHILESSALVAESVVQGLGIHDVRAVLELEILAFAFLIDEEVAFLNSQLHLVLKNSHLDTLWLWLRAQRSEHGAEGGAVGPGSVRHVTKKKGATTGYSHHRPRSGNITVLHPVTARETRPSYQFRAAP